MENLITGFIAGVMITFLLMALLVAGGNNERFSKYDKWTH